MFSESKFIQFMRIVEPIFTIYSYFFSAVFHHSVQCCFFSSLQWILKRADLKLLLCTIFCINFSCVFRESSISIDSKNYYAVQYFNLIFKWPML